MTHTHEFKTELKQLLDLIIHSLYTKKEIFLRELISNASDAIDKIRFEALTNPALTKGSDHFQIRILPDAASNKLTIEDNGIGMSIDTIVENLGTIARSGTKQFLESLKEADAKNRPELIGQFGVGFYASFMVADKVTVFSRSSDPNDTGVKWESDGQGAYTVEPSPLPSRGTRVVLHLRDDCKEFLETFRIREIVKQYSDFIEHPIVMNVEKEGKTEEQTLNSRQAIWAKSKNSVKDDEYKTFYKQISRDSEDPLKWIHVHAEGQMEYKTLLFIPQSKPFDFNYSMPKPGVSLYVKRVLIMHECESLLPPWLRFIKGVVDSSDLPLNVSRETLQHNALISRINKNLVNRILKTLEEMHDSDNEAYLKFYKEFGSILKEGMQDSENKKRIADLLLFESTHTEKGKFTTLLEYTKAMPESQKEIFYLIGETRAQLENAPCVEQIRAKGFNVLLLTDPVDEYMVEMLGEYDGKPLKAADRGALDEKPSDEQTAAYKPLTEFLSKAIPSVKEVRLSARLKDSAAVLVADDYGPSAHLERLLKRMGRGAEIGDSRRILELNPENTLVKKMLDIKQAGNADDQVEDLGLLLKDQATIAEGSKLDDPASFAKRMNRWIQKGL